MAQAAAVAASVFKWLFALPSTTPRRRRPTLKKRSALPSNAGCVLVCRLQRHREHGPLCGRSFPFLFLVVAVSGGSACCCHFSSALSVRHCFSCSPSVTSTRARCLSLSIFSLCNSSLSQLHKAMRERILKESATKSSVSTLSLPDASQVRSILQTVNV